MAARLRRWARRADWAIILVMDTPYVLVHGVLIGVPWRIVVLHWWQTSRAMWRHGR